MGITPTTVAILGGNSVSGRALELLLRGVGYETRFIDDPDAVDPGELLEGIHLLLVTAAPNAGAWGSFLASVRDTADLPVLTLSTALGETLGDGAGSVVPWPCRVQDLKGEIEAALLRASAVERA
ncbi:MAG: hypothetical protein M3Q49_13290 [Actinomycetota bacterium]|nr:hypothetical protein [Actinomycetota bacterium]